jgi:hypothetical protein
MAQLSSPDGQQTKKNAKQKYLELCEHISASRIKIEGPIPPKFWPAQYIDVFKPILTIESKRWETYGEEQSDRNCLPLPHVIKQSAKELVDLAYNCRQESTNEDKWRFQLEPKVFDRFSSKIRW